MILALSTDVRLVLGWLLAAFASYLTYLGLQGIRLERAATRRLGEFAAAERRSATERLGGTLLDRLGLSGRALRLRYRWAQLGGYYREQTLEGLVGQALAVFALALLSIPLLQPPPVVTLSAFFLAAWPLMQLGNRAKEVQAAVRRSLPEVAALLAAELSAGASPEKALQRVASLPFPVSDILHEAIEEARRQGRVLFSRPPHTGVLKETLSAWSFDPLTAFANQIDLAAAKGVDMAKQMSAVAQGLAREYRAEVTRAAETVENQLLAPMTLFFFLPMLLVVLGPLMLNMGAIFGGG